MGQIAHTAQADEKAVMAYHRDGLVDILVGLALTLGGATMAMDMPYLGGVIPALLVLVWQSAKRSITLPRVDRTELSSHARRRGAYLSGGVILGLLVLMVGLLFLFVLGTANASPELRSWLREYIALLVGMVAVVCLATVALLNRARRFWAYALLVGAAFVAGYVLHGGMPVLLVMTGGVMLAGGLIQLAQFLRQHPQMHHLD